MSENAQRSTPSEEPQDNKYEGYAPCKLHRPAEYKKTAL